MKKIDIYLISIFHKEQLQISSIQSLLNNVY